MEAEKKRKILFWLAFSVGCGILIMAFAYFSFIGQFHRYRDDMYKFAIKFPRRWQYVVHPMPGGAFAAYRPYNKGEEGFRESVNISIQVLPANIATVKDLTQTVLDQMKAVFNNLKVEQSAPILFGERRGWMVIFSCEKPDAVKIMTVWTIRDAEKAYILTYMARTENYPKYFPLVEYMIKSFKTIK